jgi:hypothetical protein
LDARGKTTVVILSDAIPSDHFFYRDVIPVRASHLGSSARRFRLPVVACFRKRDHSGIRFAIVHIRVQQRDKINKNRLEFKLAVSNFERSHPTGESRFNMLEMAPRQRASGLPRTTPRSPFLKPLIPLGEKSPAIIRDQPASRSDFEQPGERWLFGIRSLAGFLFASIPCRCAAR